MNNLLRSYSICIHFQKDEDKVIYIKLINLRLLNTYYSDFWANKAVFNIVKSSSLKCKENRLTDYDIYMNN